MSSPIQRPRTSADDEAALLADARRIMEKSATIVGDTAVPTRPDFIRDDPDRLEERVTPPAGPDEDEDDDEEPPSAAWGSQPSIRNQSLKHPATVRMVDPETKVFNMSDEEHLKSFNRIQKGTSDAQAPTFAITEIDKTTIQGSWVVTFYKIQYQKLI